MLYVDRTLCTRCAMCVRACPTGAISLGEHDETAVIDAALCDECLLCIEVCPNGAIRRLESLQMVPVPQMDVWDGNQAPEVISLAPTDRRSVSMRRPGAISVLAGAALNLAGNWLLPRLADAIVSAVERRLIHGPEAVVSDASFRTSNSPLVWQRGAGRGRPGRQRRTRHRGGG
ncbi:MAG: DUF362 domain-containing protein [Chloroflexota bacterium]